MVMAVFARLLMGAAMAAAVTVATSDLAAASLSTMST
jgi:hypothetical protein